MRPSHANQERSRLRNQGMCSTTSGASSHGARTGCPTRLIPFQAGGHLTAFKDGFAGTDQPLPGESGVSIWYLEDGFQTIVPPEKAALYVGRENDAKPVWSPDSGHIAFIRVPGSPQSSDRTKHNGRDGRIDDLRCSPELVDRRKRILLRSIQAGQILLEGKALRGSAALEPAYHCPTESTQKRRSFGAYSVLGRRAKRR